MNQLQEVFNRQPAHKMHIINDLQVIEAEDMESQKRVVKYC